VTLTLTQTDLDHLHLQAMGEILVQVRLTSDSSERRRLWREYELLGDELRRPYDPALSTLPAEVA